MQEEVTQKTHGKIFVKELVVEGVGILSMK